MSKKVLRFPTVFLIGLFSFLLVLFLLPAASHRFCPSSSGGSVSPGDTPLSVCHLQLHDGKAAFSLNDSGDYALYIPNNRDYTLSVNGCSISGKPGQEYIFCNLNDFSDTFDFDVRITCANSTDPLFSGPQLYLGTHSGIQNLIQSGSFQRFFVIGISFTIILYSLSLFVGKPSETYLLFLALLAYTTSARTLWNARPILKQIPTANLLLLGTIMIPGTTAAVSYHLCYLLLKLLIAWLRCRLIREFIPVKLGSFSYFTYCIFGFVLSSVFCFAGRGYYACQFWMLFVHVLEFVIILKGSEKQPVFSSIFSAALGLTVSLRLIDLYCVTTSETHGLFEAVFKPQGIIETFSIIAFVIVINLKYAEKYQEADLLFQSLEETNRNLESIVASRTEKLTETCESLSRLQSQKSEFMANIIHNLKTPLFALYGYTDMALDELDEHPEEARHFLNEINRNTTYAKELIENLFLSMRLEDEKVLYNRIVFPLSDLIDHLYSTSLPKAEQAGVRLSFSSPDDPVILHGDPLYLRQALQNILDNAVRHSDPDTVIYLSSSVAKEQLSLSIKNRGEGITPQNLPLIFNRYFSGSTKNTGSSGLGLTISKDIIEQHGGTIAVTSSPGEETEFCITLPL